jgi:hypothetical protein
MSGEVVSYSVVSHWGTLTDGTVVNAATQVTDGGSGFTVTYTVQGGKVAHSHVSKGGSGYHTTEIFLVPQAGGGGWEGQINIVT